ncbi:MAG: hypothetical protein WC761_01940 [Candidatus Paceibacterota bacterium]|jgi:hypothetical protein
MGDSRSWCADHEEEVLERNRIESVKYNGFKSQSDIDRFMLDHKAKWTSQYYWALSPGSLYLLNDPREDFISIWKSHSMNRVGQLLKNEEKNVPSISYVVYLEPHLEYQISPLHVKLVKVLYQESTYITYLRCVRKMPEWIFDCLKTASKNK